MDLNLGPVCASNWALNGPQSRPCMHLNLGPAWMSIPTLRGSQSGPCTHFNLMACMRSQLGFWMHLNLGGSGSLREHRMDLNLGSSHNSTWTWTIHEPQCGSLPGSHCVRSNLRRSSVYTWTLHGSQSGSCMWLNLGPAWIPIFALAWISMWVLCGSQRAPCMDLTLGSGWTSL